MAQFMEVGIEFESFDAFQAAMEQYEDTHFVQFSRVDSRTVEKAQESSVAKTYNPEIKFAQVHYACTFGPKKAVSRSSGIRNATSRKIDCPVHIRLSATPDGQRLVIKESVLEGHNHEVSEEQYKSLSRQKQLDEETELEIYNLISMHEDKRLARMLIRDKLTKETGRSISVKDILNIEKRVAKKLENKNELGEKKSRSRKDSTEENEDMEHDISEDRTDNRDGDSHEDSEVEDRKPSKKKPTVKVKPSVTHGRPKRNRREPSRFRDALENGEKVLHTFKNNVVSIVSPDDIEELESQATPTPVSSKKFPNKVKEETRGRKRKISLQNEDTDSEEKFSKVDRDLAIKEEMLEIEKKKMTLLQDIVKKLDQIIENQKSSQL